MTYHGIDELRQACGGAGFLDASGIKSYWCEITPFPTFEGVSVIMLQQSSRYLFKKANDVARGKSCSGYFAYMNNTETLCKSKSQARTVAEFLDWEHLTAALSTRSAYYIQHVNKLMKSNTSDKKAKENELFAIEVQKMT